MLIYSKENDVLKVTQVVVGGGTSDVSSHRVSEETRPDKHQAMLKQLKEGQILVTGNTSIMGDGIFLDNVYTQYTEIESKNKDAETPTRIATVKELLANSEREKINQALDALSLEESSPRLPKGKTIKR